MASLMNASVAVPPSATRPYRSKRSRPCDTCRKRKKSCYIEGSPPCLACRHLKVDCTFNQPPARRATADASTPRGMWSPLVVGSNSNPLPWESTGPGPSSVGLDVLEPAQRSVGDQIPSPRLGDITYPLDQLIGSQGNRFPDSSMDLDHLAEIPPDLAFSLDSCDRVIHDHSEDRSGSRSLHSPESATVRPKQQPVKSLDQIEGFTPEYFGLSNETDPYLLRHFRFADDGDTLFFRVHFRREADENPGDINSRAIPIHFKLSSEELGKLTMPDTTVRKDSTPTSVRDELDTLIPHSTGRRLVGLFVQYVFPTMPIISRSQIGLSARNVWPSDAALDKIATPLLAAIYALSVQFCRYDQQLCVSNVYTSPPKETLWRIAFEEIMREIHTPRLAILQAALLYLQKPQPPAASAAADSPFRWSFLGFAVSLSTSLGLHLDCQDWPIPPWEKRLRRRLWWIVYSEATWRSLIIGFPSIINEETWDVDELTELDFLTDSCPTEPDEAPSMPAGDASGTDRAADYMHFARLTTIAAQLYRDFYTLKATKNLSNDLSASLNAAGPLRTRLQEWCNSHLNQLKNWSGREIKSSEKLVTESTCRLELAYLTLELLLYRALLRPLGVYVPREDAGPEARTSPKPNANSFDDTTKGLDDAAVASVILAAEVCAEHFTSFTAGLVSKDLGGFWYSWARVCFSAMSNFVLLLLIQSPTVLHARRASLLLDRWRQTMRIQSWTSDLVKLGLLRLDAIYWSGLQKLFRCPSYVEEVLQGEVHSQ